MLASTGARAVVHHSRRDLQGGVLYSTATEKFHTFIEYPQLPYCTRFTVVGNSRVTGLQERSSSYWSRYSVNASVRELPALFSRAFNIVAPWGAFLVYPSSPEK